MVQNIRVIDGLGNQPLNNRDVVIESGEITRISKSGAHLPPASVVEVIDGHGLTMLPGLIDLHVHLGKTEFPIPAEKSVPAVEDLGQAMRALLYAGVTTVMDLGNSHEVILQARDAQGAGKMPGPRIVATGAMFDRLHTIQSVFELPTKGQAEIEQRLDRYQNDGIEVIKLYAGMSNWSARHLMREAHSRGMRGIADFWCGNLSRDLFAVTEVDAFAHGACHRLEESDANWILENDKFAIMTLTIFDAMGGHRQFPDYKSRSFLMNPLIVDVIGQSVLEQYYKNFQQIRDAFYDTPESLYQSQYFPELKPLLGYNLENLKMLHSKGVLLGMGTDGNSPPGNFFGDSLHREMELHVEAGLTPLETIQIATYNGAKILKLEDQIGSIQIGKKADLLIVEGNPTQNISHTRRIVHVIQQGKLVDRAALH